MGMLANRLPQTLIEMGFRVQLGDSWGRGRRSMSKDVQSHHPGAHMRLQASMRRMFDEPVSTYDSTKSSLMHGPVVRGRPNIFGGRGRVLPSPSDSGPPLGPSATMGHPRQIPPMWKGPLLASPCVHNQAVQQAAPQGAPVPLLEQSFTQATGLKMGILMLPPVGPGLPSQGDSAT